MASRLVLLANGAMIVPLFAGCLGGGPGTVQADETGAEPALATVAGNETVNATIPNVDDPWGPDEVERVLMEGIVESSPPACTGPNGHYGEIWAGCVNFELPPGTLVPPGTAAIRIEGDSSQATRHGSWAAFLMRTVERSWFAGNDAMSGEPSSEDRHAWRFALTPGDWDYPAQQDSVFVFHFMGFGETATTLRGPIRALVVAERDPDWVPPSTVDPWSAPPPGASPQEGVLTLHDENATVAQQARANQFFGGSGDSWRNTTDAVPAGTDQLVIALQWGPIEGCPPSFSCAVRVDLATPTRFYGGYSQYPPVEVGDGYALMVLHVPDDVPPEPAWVNESRLGLSTYAFNACNPPLDAFVEECKRTLTDARYDVRLRVEAWQGEADLDAVKERLGVA